MTTSRFYAAEWQWSWDHTNTEYHFFCLEQVDQTLEKLKELAKGYAKDFFKETCPDHGSRKLLRLFAAEKIVMIESANSDSNVKEKKFAFMSDLTLIHDFTKE